MDEEKVPSWVRATVALLIILVAYYELKRDRETWDG